MTKEQFLTVLDKNLDGTASKEEVHLLEDFYAHQLQRSEAYWSEWDLTEKERIKIELLRSLNTAIDEDLPARSALFGRVAYWGIAASALFIIGLSFLYLLYYSAPSEVNYLTRTTASGQKATITLSDGSVVKLNSGSSITFPEHFDKATTRSVQLSGEAFFEVERDESTPFTIQSGGLLTTVLGTSFNVAAFESQNTIEVTVATGKVHVEAVDSASLMQGQTLTPGKQAVFDKGSRQLSVHETDLAPYLAWKDGIIYLSEASQQQVFNQLARWYGVTFRLVNEPDVPWEVSGEFKDMSLELVLNTIGHTKGFEFQIQEQEVVVEFTN